MAQPENCVTLLEDAECDHQHAGNPTIPFKDKQEQIKLPSRRRPSPAVLPLATTLLLALLLTLLPTTNADNPLNPPSNDASPAKPKPKGVRAFVKRELVLAAASNDEEVPMSSSAVPAAERTVLECFQVVQPVLGPTPLVFGQEGAYWPPGDVGGSGDNEDGAEEGGCTVELMRHDFGWSYDLPFVGSYSPPTCAPAFDRITLNLTVVSHGRQFDRLGALYFNNTEIFRTSTAEPVSPPGIRWEYHKDVTPFLSLFRRPQTVIFDLGNLVDDTYTGWFNVTLSATFFTASEDVSPAARPADLILAVSKGNGPQGKGSWFHIPSDLAAATVPGGAFPRNANRAVFSISANGQATEEFWWSNVLSSDAAAFKPTMDDTLPALSPWREVQLLIDGELVGVWWPFPIVFTGGVVPSLHRPVVGLQAFDLLEHEIDISPWLGVLCDGADHVFEIRVAGLDDTTGNENAVVTASVDEYWVATGKIFVWTDKDADAVTTGGKPKLLVGVPSIQISHATTQNPDTGLNETLTYVVRVARDLAVQSEITTADGTRTVLWTQSLTYRNDGHFWDGGFSQVNDMLIESSDEAVILTSDDSNGTSKPYYRTTHTYPIFANQSYSISPEGNLTISGALMQGLSISVAGASVFPSGIEAFATLFPGDNKPGTHLSTQRNGTAWFFRNGDNAASSGFGSTDQWFIFGTAANEDNDGEELYTRDVSVVNGTVVGDREALAGERERLYAATFQKGLPGAQEYAAPKDGRGKGDAAAAAAARGRRFR